MAIPISVPMRLRKRTTQTQPPIGVLSLSVHRLFGKLNYPEISISGLDQIQSRIAVIYGDNGTGKTTILKLLYACLSPEAGSGLRTLIAQTPFERFEVNLSNHLSIIVSKDALVGGYQFRIGRRESAFKTFDVMADPDGNVSPQESITQIEVILRQIGLDILLVDHNRTVKSTYAFVSDLAREGPQFLDTMPVDYSVAVRSNTVWQTAQRWREPDLRFPLAEVVEALERWFRDQAFKQGTAGEQNAAAVYLEIAKASNRDRRKVSERIEAPAVNVVERIRELKTKTASFVKYGLLTGYPFDEFVAIYASASKSKKIR